MKNIIEENEKTTVNTKEIEILKKHFPNCFNKDGEFQIDKFEKRVSQEVDVTKEGYELRWLGKNYARLLANVETETMIVDDKEHNDKVENKNSKNIYIEGDNIDVLKHLKNAYSEKIKMIYIDPPYNTGSDGFVYKDDRKYTKEELAELINITEEEAQRILSFNTKGSNSHSAWLTFMYPRLLTARELLSDDGVIFISIDDNEVSQLKLLCDEVFGEENFVAEFIWRKKKESSNDGKDVSVKTEYILSYKKTNAFMYKRLSLKEEYVRKSYSNSNNDIRGLWRSVSIKLSVGHQGGGYQYAITTPSGKKYDEMWTLPQRTFNDLLADNRIFFGKKDDSLPQKKIFLEESKGQIADNLLLECGTNKEGKNMIKELFNDIYFETPKPVTLIKYLIEISTLSSDPNSLILDFFSGSATTAHAVMQLNAEDEGNRKFIMVQIPEEIDPKKSKAAYDFCVNGLKQEPVITTVGKERIKRAASKIKQENESNTIDLGFKLFKIKKIPEKYIERMKDEKNELLVTNMLSREELQALLITWKTYDGYPLTKELKTVQFDKYESYAVDRILYLVNTDFNLENLLEFIKRLDSDGDFVINKIVIFGYHFNSDILLTIKDMVTTYRNKKSIELDVEVRY